VRLVAALGGNALAPRGSAALEEQHAAVSRAVAALTPLAREHELIVTHGNGPQVGWLAAQARAAGESVPLDVLGAETEGMLGYWIEQELANALPDRDVVALLTQVEVDADDPAFANPTKPIGPVIPAAEAERLMASGFACAPDRGGMRRVVASPVPRRILEQRTIALLVRLGVLVVCGGGGGIPVIRDARGRHHGAAAVVDKDRSAELLASELGADGLLLLTDVPAVFADWPARERAIRRASSRALGELRFEPGSMAPKVEAACRFATRGGVAWIGDVDDAARILRGEAGTRIVAGAGRLEIEGARAPR
jgi:carbamate kinase